MHLLIVNFLLISTLSIFWFVFNYCWFALHVEDNIQLVKANLVIATFHNLVLKLFFKYVPTS